MNFNIVPLPSLNTLNLHGRFSDIYLRPPSRLCNARRLSLSNSKTTERISMIENFTTDEFVAWLEDIF